MGALSPAFLSQEALALVLGSLGTAGTGMARGSWCQPHELLPACPTSSPPPPGAQTRPGLERSGQVLGAIESLTLNMMPLISKLLRTQEADLKPAEHMVKGEKSKHIVLKFCWGNILVYAPHTLLSKDFALIE